MADKINVRQIGGSEWRDVRGLTLELLKADPEAFVEQYDEVATSPEERWAQGIDNASGAVFVAYDGVKAVGMGRINYYDDTKDMPVMHKLGVLPSYRGKGIAKQLIEAREAWAKGEGAKRIRTYVIKGNQRIQDILTKYGYEAIGEQGGNQIIYEKDLIID